jgi:nitrite reductase/ring-hydroxylating ferredoxin subunit
MIDHGLPPSDARIHDAPASDARALPDFSEGNSLRQRAWAAGLDPAYWYPVEYDHAVAPGQVVEIKCKLGSVALFRGRDGRLGAVEDRCAHRQVKLSSGRVEDCRITCRYHGWSYETDGRLAGIPHELFGKSFPTVHLRSYPVESRYGFIWVFFGDPRLADQRPIPRIPEIEGTDIAHPGERPRAPSDAWVKVPIDFTVKAHPTAIVNNVMDSTHVATLHRKFQTRTMVYGKVTRCVAEGDSVTVTHDITLDKGGMLRWLLNPLKIPFQDATYAYPYLVVSVGNVYKLWNFMLPLDDHTTRLFMISCADRIKIPFTPYLAPEWLVGPATRLAKHLLVTPLFTEDVWSFEAEQEGYVNSPGSSAVDLHPAIRPSYQLTIRKWEEHLARSRGERIALRAKAG